MNKNIKKLLTEYDRKIAFKKAPEELKQKLNLVPSTRPKGHPFLWQALSYGATAAACIGIALPVGYILAKEGHIGNPQIICDPIADGEAFLITNFDQSLRTPVLTFFSENDYQIALYFAVQDGENHCFYIKVTEKDGYLEAVNPALSLDETLTDPYGSFVLATDESVDFMLNLYEDDLLIDHWNVTFDIPTYLARF